MTRKQLEALAACHGASGCLTCPLGQGPVSVMKSGVTCSIFRPLTAAFALRLADGLRESQWHFARIAHAPSTAWMFVREEAAEALTSIRALLAELEEEP